MTKRCGFDRAEGGYIMKLLLSVNISKKKQFILTWRSLTVRLV